MRDGDPKEFISYYECTCLYHRYLPSEGLDMSGNPRLLLRIVKTFNEKIEDDKHDVVTDILSSNEFKLGTKCILNRYSKHADRL